MFEQFPKQRPALPAQIAEIYEDHYRKNREGETTASSLAQRMEAWLHRQIARDVRNGGSARSTLEIGAGTLNQMVFEPDVGPYDIIEPFTKLYEGSDRMSRVRNAYADISAVPEGQSYDRITSVAAFEHICDLPAVVARSALLLNEAGRLRVAIPSEGTILWKLGWKLTTGLEFRLKHGVSYGHLMRHEHVNTAREIEDVLRYFYESVEAKAFGVSASLSFYRFFECSSPMIDRAIRSLHVATTST